MSLLVPNDNPSHVHQARKGGQASICSFGTTARRMQNPWPCGLTLQGLRSTVGFKVGPTP